MTYATKSDLTRFRDRRYAETTIEGLTFRVQSLSELEQSRLDAAMLDAKGQATAEGIAENNSRLIAAAWVDEHGNRICKDGDHAFIGELDPRITQPLAAFIGAHCGGRGGGAEEFEARVKNSDETAGGALPTGSHSPWEPLTLRDS